MQCGGRRRTVIDLLNEESAGFRQIELIGKLPVWRNVNRLRDAEHRAGYMSGRAIFFEHRFHARDRHREADADAAGLTARGLRSENHRVDADHIAARIEQRSAAVAWIDRGIGLNEAFHDDAIFVFQLPSQRAYDTGCQSAAKVERVADRENFLSDEEPVGIAERERRQLAAGIDLEDRQIVATVNAQNFAIVLLG